ncbi:kinase-like domain-containing protein [Chaetomium fimeti]|uniref:Kinase-like domain-containing protein n=1 Tax=Chaetomium fimeti TaxID=1854472 RepID=A0AAE0HBW2_9PEZI|nr:kinase-like domain-containing protein [Chaetomium fimeti]
MPPLSKTEEQAIADRIVEELSQTPYALSSITQLHGGTANFVFRGTLAKPLPAEDESTATTVIIKHSTEFVAINRDFPLDVTRCTFEESMLAAVASFKFPPAADGTKIKTPRLYLFSHESNTQVLEDLPGTDDLKSAFFLPNAADLLPGSSPLTIGHHLGSWLRSYHTWASAPEQVPTLAAVGENRPMRDLKRMITYDTIIPVLENYPELLVGCRETLETLVAALGKEFDKPPFAEADEHWGMIHGDFWSGNVLIPTTPWKAPGQGDNKLFVIDWEFAQYGHRAYDFGQMIGDLWERKIFNDLDIVMPVVQGVIEGYGEVSEELAFRAAIHTGVQLISWYRRRPRSGALMAPPEVIIAGLTIGRDIILKAWEKDRDFFETGVLASLFAKKG